MHRSASLSIAVLASLAIACSTAGSGPGEPMGGFSSSSPKADAPGAIHHYELWHDAGQQAVSVIGFNHKDDVLISARISLVSESTPDGETHHYEVEQLYPSYTHAVFSTDGSLVEGEVPGDTDDLLEQMQLDFDQQLEEGDGSGKSDGIGSSFACGLNCGAAIAWLFTGNGFGLVINGGLCASMLLTDACF